MAIVIHKTMLMLLDLIASDPKLTQSLQEALQSHTLTLFLYTQLMQSYTLTLFPYTQLMQSDTLTLFPYAQLMQSDL
jgi:hypothetical protein